MFFFSGTTQTNSILAAEQMTEPAPHTPTLPRPTSRFQPPSPSKTRPRRHYHRTPDDATARPFQRHDPMGQPLTLARSSMMAAAWDAIPGDGAPTTTHGAAPHEEVWSTTGPDEAASVARSRRDHRRLDLVVPFALGDTVASPPASTSGIVSEGVTIGRAPLAAQSSGSTPHDGDEEGVLRRGTSRNTSDSGVMCQATVASPYRDERMAPQTTVGGGGRSSLWLSPAQNSNESGEGGLSDGGAQHSPGARWLVRPSFGTVASSGSMVSDGSPEAGDGELRRVDSAILHGRPQSRHRGSGDPYSGFALTPCKGVRPARRAVEGDDMDDPLEGSPTSTSHRRSRSHRTVSQVSAHSPLRGGAHPPQPHGRPPPGSSPQPQRPLPAASPATRRMVSTASGHLGVTAPNVNPFSPHRSLLLGNGGHQPLAPPTPSSKTAAAPDGKGTAGTEVHSAWPWQQFTGAAAHRAIVGFEQVYPEVAAANVCAPTTNAHQLHHAQPYSIPDTSPAHAFTHLRTSSGSSSVGRKHKRAVDAEEPPSSHANRGAPLSLAEFRSGSPPRAPGGPTSLESPTATPPSTCSRARSATLAFTATVPTFSSHGPHATTSICGSSMPTSLSRASSVANVRRFLPGEAFEGVSAPAVAIPMASDLLEGGSAGHTATPPHPGAVRSDQETGSGTPRAIDFTGGGVACRRRPKRHQQQQSAQLHKALFHDSETDSSAHSGTDSEEEPGIGRFGPSSAAGGRGRAATPPVQMRRLPGTGGSPSAASSCSSTTATTLSHGRDAGDDAVADALDDAAVAGAASSGGRGGTHGWFGIQSTMARHSGTARKDHASGGGGGVEQEVVEAPPPRHQFYHYVPFAPPEDQRPGGELVPLHQDVDGTVFLATSLLDGLPYAVKEVPFAADEPTHLPTCSLELVAPASLAYQWLQEQQLARRGGGDPQKRMNGSEPSPTTTAADDRLVPPAAIRTLIGSVERSRYASPPGRRRADDAINSSRDGGESDSGGEPSSMHHHSASSDEQRAIFWSSPPTSQEGALPPYEAFCAATSVSSPPQSTAGAVSSSTLVGNAGSSVTRRLPTAVDDELLAHHVLAGCPNAVRYFNVFRDTVGKVYVFQTAYYPIGTLFDHFLGRALHIASDAAAACATKVPPHGTSPSAIEASSMPTEDVIIKAIADVFTATSLLHGAGLAHCNLHPRNCFVATDLDGGSGGPAPAAPDIVCSREEDYTEPGDFCRFVVGQFGAVRRVPYPLTASPVACSLASASGLLDDAACGGDANGVEDDDDHRDEPPQHRPDGPSPSLGSTADVASRRRLHRLRFETLQHVSNVTCPSWAPLQYEPPQPANGPSGDELGGAAAHFVCPYRRDLHTFANGLIHLLWLCQHQIAAVAPRKQMGPTASPAALVSEPTVIGVRNNPSLFAMRIELRDIASLFQSPTATSGVDGVRSYDSSREGLYSRELFDLLEWMCRVSSDPTVTAHEAANRARDLREERRYRRRRRAPPSSRTHNQSPLPPVRPQHVYESSPPPREATSTPEPEGDGAPPSMNILEQTIVDTLVSRIADLRRRVRAAELRAAPSHSRPGHAAAVEAEVAGEFTPTKDVPPPSAVTSAAGGDAHSSFSSASASAGGGGSFAPVVDACGPDAAGSVSSPRATTGNAANPAAFSPPSGAPPAASTGGAATPWESPHHHPPGTVRRRRTLGSPFDGETATGPYDHRPLATVALPPRPGRRLSSSLGLAAAGDVSLAGSLTPGGGLSPSQSKPPLPAVTGGAVDTPMPPRIASPGGAVARTMHTRRTVGAWRARSTSVLKLRCIA